MPSFRDLLGVELPIIQAPMAGVQGSALAIAVSNAGGLGSLPCAMLSAEAMHDELTAITSATRKPFNVNFFCHTPPVPDPEREAAWRALLRPYYVEAGLDIDRVPAGPGRTPFSHEHIDVLTRFKPPVVSFHFGLPGQDLLERVRALGATILSSATTVEEARWLNERGVDAIIAQGLEAGGHRGTFLSHELTTQIGTLALVPQIVNAVGVPVIAAGGIADSSGVAAALALGAAAVQIGTAYMLCPEATTSAVHRAALKSHAARHTALTNVFTGRPARGIVNRLIREIGPMSSLAPEFPLATAAIAPLRGAAEAQGSGDFSPLWSGQNPSGCRDVPAATLTVELVPGIVQQ
ncbi:MAG TPA: nitronate monooxygenase [Vicinamibacterales bacterium]|nr:nitronate monooxygenase [Vicinamibacterales bacterium]